MARNILLIALPAGILIFFAFLAIASAQTPASPKYVPLVGIPGLTGEEQKNMTLPQYINALYFFTISVGALLGVVKIAIAGVKYSMSDVITDKADAKRDITGVLLGLAILLLPFIVLNTIYPGLTNLDVLKLKDDDKVKLQPAKDNPTQPPPGGGNPGVPPTDSIGCPSEFSEEIGGTPCSPFDDACTPVPGTIVWSESSCASWCYGMRPEVGLNPTPIRGNGNQPQCKYTLPGMGSIPGA